jgi:hypothetical protein
MQRQATVAAAEVADISKVALVAEPVLGSVDAPVFWSKQSFA